MKITVCDDSIEDLMSIEKYIWSYKNIHSQLEYTVEKYSDSVKLFKKISEGFMSDIFILDMIMPGMSGIDLGKKIRMDNKNSVIIFITSSDDFALEAFELHALRYLVKPFSRESFFEAMDYALLYTNINKEPLYLIKAQDGIVSVPHSRIEYIENISRVLHVNLSDGSLIKSVFIRRSFEMELENLLSYPNYIQIHKSFIINMDYVKKLSSEYVIMDSGVNIPVSKKKSQEVKRSYLFYVADKYR